MAAESIELLIEFTKDEDPRTRATAIMGLAKVRDPRGFAPVVVALFDPVDEVRIAAAAALGMLRDCRAFEPLVECLSDPCEQFAASCAWALSQVPAPQSFSKLLEVMGSSQYPENVRVAAITAAVESVGATEGEITAGFPAVSEEGPVAGQDYEPPQVGALRATLLEVAATASGEVKASALWGLGKLPVTPAAFEAAVAALGDAHEWTVRYAIEALANFGDASAVPALRPLLEHESAIVAGLAATALERLR